MSHLVRVFFKSKAVLKTALSVTDRVDDLRRSLASSRHENDAHERWLADLVRQT
jgi:hypothetical protein